MINSLKKAREEKNLSLSDVSDALKIRECYLDALERGDYASLPELVYAVGFVKSYAKLLEINDDNIIQEIKGHVIPLPEFSVNNRLTGTNGRLWSGFFRNKNTPPEQKNEMPPLHIREKKRTETQNAGKNNDKSEFSGVSAFLRDFSGMQIVYALAIIVLLIAAISLL
ncbi:MAG: helix-turn-helix domain-containing protein [Holosporaceae bacterium]|nr:helix-turn-helix domain-containing protein [Holosporaceae bacterium]